MFNEFDLSQGMQNASRIDSCLKAADSFLFHK